MFIEVQFVLWELFLNVSVKSFETDHISFFVLAVSLFVFDLEAVIGEMCKFIIYIAHVKISTTSSDISSVVEIEV